MESSNVRKLHLVAGQVRAACACCAVRQTLVTHPEVDESRRVCPATGRTHVDRGDGLFEPDGDGVAVPGAAAHEEAAAESPLLSDRPKRTGPKTRIELERATFAAPWSAPEVSRWTGR